MRRIVLALVTMVAFSGLAEAHTRHHNHHHHSRHGYYHQGHHIHFGRVHHRHKFTHYRRHVRMADAAKSVGFEPWTAGASTEAAYPQAQFTSGRIDARRDRPGNAAPSTGIGRLVRASWYGGGERLSSRTANGERFNRGGLTAAHRSLPFGTRLQVTNLKTGLAVVVRVNDRGPAAGTGNSLDLARGAAHAIGLRSTGAVRMVVLN
jgi:rare lipoprotein A (peptidoglycan hydrolase)